LLFGLFVLLNFVLLVRPEELLGDFAGGRLYLIVICCSLPAALGRILDRFSDLKFDPVSCCVLAFYVLTVASSILPLGIMESTTVAGEFGKVVITYFVGLAALSTPREYLRYLNVLPLLIAGIAGVGLLQFHGYIDNPAIPQVMQADFDEEGNPIEYPRLCSSGVFNDPNDLCLALAVGLALCGYHLIERASVFSIMMSAALVPYFLYALILTQSRGGLLAVAAMLGSLCVSRFGASRAIPLAIFMVLALVGLASGRQASFDSSSETAQSRIQHWAEGLEYWESAPLFGLGFDQHLEYVGYVAHNSYVHAYVETGLLGGTAFVGIFFAAILGLALTPCIDDEETTYEEERVNDSRPFIVAVVVGYCMGMFSLSRNYVIPTYLIVALANSCLLISHPVSERTWFSMDAAMLRRILFVGLATLIVLKIFVKVFVRYD
jgi:putative inorganic carbon (hco3(-)) transporter